MTYLPWRTKKTEGRFSHFGSEILNFIGGGIYFLGKTRLVLRGEGAPRKEGKKTC